MPKLFHAADIPDDLKQYFEPMTNSHPTAKSVKLFQYLIELLSPSGGVILDPFCGSGSTLVAAIQTGRDAIGIEMDESYCKIAEARCKWAEENMPEAQEPEQLSMAADVLQAAGG